MRDRVARLLGEVRDGLDPGVGDHRDRDRERELAQVGATPQWTFERQRSCGLKTSTKPSSTSSSCVAKSTTARTMFSRAASWIPTMLSATRTTTTRDAADDVPRVRPQRLPEDREVVRDEERRDRDRDDVVQHLRPAGAERDELVERVPREARRAAGLGVANRPLRVGRGGRGEDQPRDDEDERRQPERVDGGDAERVVDRRADVAVGRREQRGRPEHPLESVSLAPPAGHRWNLPPVRDGGHPQTTTSGSRRSAG